MKHHLAELLGERRASWLAGADDIVPRLAQALDQRIDVRRFAGTVDAFECDETAGHSGKSAKCVSADID
jgi:hypothetical protein